MVVAMAPKAKPKAKAKGGAKALAKVKARVRPPGGLRRPAHRGGNQEERRQKRSGERGKRSQLGRRPCWSWDEESGWCAQRPYTTTRSAR